jgi:DNA-binding LacI/PurR family transcriptional regulator
MNFRPYSQPLFQHTPPTALIISESLLFIAAQQHPARRGIAAPENISLICPPSIFLRDKEGHEIDALIEKIA